MQPQRTIFDDLEPGPLRDELFPQQTAEQRKQAEEQAKEQEARLAREWSKALVFTGNGAEYFRIWVVNLALTVATLGIYSAWAKVRKTQYFWQNTQFNGYRFNYHGSPVAVLRGRVLAVLLFVAYSWSFDISATVALVTIGVLCLLAPWLFLRAQEFKLRNTSYRGLRFGFDMRMPSTYPKLLLLALLWFSATIGGLLLVERPQWLLALTLLPFLLFPWMHHSLKQLQHSRSSYGSLNAAFSPCGEEFYSTYALVGVAFVFAAAASTVVAVMLAVPLVRIAGALGFDLYDTTVIVSGAGFGSLVAYIMVFPLAAARIQRSVWSHTTLGPLWFHTYIETGHYFRLVLTCAVLTLLTLGLYWPFASVRLARYRIECLQVRAHGDIVAEIFDTARAVRGPRRGDGAVDLFGLEIGL